jgi:hypothetical protein
MLLIIMQQVHPDFIIAPMQAQHASIIAQHAGSPLVQVMQTPSAVASNLHIPIVRLQQQTIIPFIIQQQLHKPPAIMVQRFWSMPAETLSSQVHTIFMPPGHLETVIVQRGTIIMFVPAGVGAEVPIIPLGPDIGMPGMAIPARSIIIVVAILISCFWQSTRCSSPRWARTCPLWQRRFPISSEEVSEIGNRSWTTWSGWPSRHVPNQGRPADSLEKLDPPAVDESA